jgi:hypothetical protein
MRGSVTSNLGSPKPGGGVRQAPATAAPQVVSALIPPPVVATTVPTTVKTSKPLYEAYRLRNLDVAHKAAIIKILQQLTFTPLDQASLVKIDIGLPQPTHLIRSLLCENDKQRGVTITSLENIRNAAREVSDSDLAKLAKHFDRMVKGGFEKDLIGYCVNADEKAACAAACVSIAALPAESSRLAKECENLTTDKAALSTRLNSPETTTRLSDHQRITTETEALRLEIQTLQHSQLSTAVEMEAHAATLADVTAYNAEIQAQNTVLAAQKDAIVALGKEIQQKKTDTASSLDKQKKALDARHVELEKQAQSLSALKSKLTDDISMLDVMITASNSGHLAYVCTELVEAALSKWALAKLDALGTTLMNKDGKAMVQALLKVQKKIQTETMRMTAAAFSPLYGTLNARPPETDAKIDACLTSISTQLVEFDSAYKAYSELKEPYQTAVAKFNTERDTDLTEVNTLVERQAADIRTLENLETEYKDSEKSKKSGLTDKITLLNKASQTAGTETSAITAKLNIKITQYKANIGRLEAMEAVQKGLVADVLSSNAGIRLYNAAVADLETKVSVAKEDAAHIARYNSSTVVLDHRKEITLETMEKAPDKIAECKARLPQSPPPDPSKPGSGGASGSDPYLLLSCDIRKKFTPEDFSKLKIPPQIRPLDCRSLSSSFAPIAVATGKEIETIQARLSEIRVVIPKAEDCVSDITVQDATTIAREFPSIRMLAQPNQPEITVRVPFITKEMLSEKLKELNEQLQALKDSGLKDSGSKDALALKERIKERITKWNALITEVTAVNADKLTTTQVTCPVTNQTKRAPFLTTVTEQANGDVWAFTESENEESYPTYRWERPTTTLQVADNAATTAKLNTSLQELTQQLGKQPA